MDKENGKGNTETNGSSAASASKISTSSNNASSSATSLADQAALLDAANLFSAYWPRTDSATAAAAAAAAANSASLFAAASGGFGLPPHPSMPFGMLAPNPATSRALPSAATAPYPPSTSASGAAAAYNNAYSNTLSVAASQAASLGIPVASAAWWSMASHFAAQDYLARLQASGLNFQSGLNTANELSYAASLGLNPAALTGHQTTTTSSTTKSSTAQSSSSKSSKHSNSTTKSSASSRADKHHSSSLNYHHGSSIPSHHSLHSAYGFHAGSATHTQASKYSASGQNAAKLTNSSGNLSTTSSSATSAFNYSNSVSDMSSGTKRRASDVHTSASQSVSSKMSNKMSGGSLTSTSISGSNSKVSSIFTSPLTMVGGAGSAYHTDKNSSTESESGHGASLLTSDFQAAASSLSTSGILSDSSSILGGVRLPPDTEIIKYTSSIVGPKIPGTTNRGRKKTISLDPPSVSVHPSHAISVGMLLERHKRQKYNNDHYEMDSISSLNATMGHDRVEVIKLPATNGPFSNDAIANHSNSSGSDTPLNLSLKPASSAFATNNVNSSLHSLSTMSANIGSDRVSRRKPGPKPRRFIPAASTNSIVNTPHQVFSPPNSGELPRPPSQNNDAGSDGGGSTSSTYTPTPSSASNHHGSHTKEGRPRNLGRGVSKPKKNTVASLLAQSRALGIKPMPMLDPNVSMNQQLNFLKSNILAAQQYIAEAGSDEKALNKFLQERLRSNNPLSDSSNMDASTDSDTNLTDSNLTDSEMESEVASQYSMLGSSTSIKKLKQYDESALRIPLERGWRRETIVRGVTKSGALKGDVTYIAPDSANKFKQMSDITQYLEYQKSGDLTRDNFTFSCRIILGEYLQPKRPDLISESPNDFISLTEDEVMQRLDDARLHMRSNIPAEQRIEIARKQQAARAAARLDREQARLAKEIERNERQEAARRDKELRSQQMLEGRKRLAFTLEQKMQIIGEIERGKTKSDVSRELGLASSTVATIWKNRDNILSAYGSGTGPPSAESTATPFAPTTIPLHNHCDSMLLHTAKRKKQEEMEKHKQEEQQRKQQEREMKRQQAAILKEQERERRRQHMALVKSLESRRKLEEKERKKQQLLAEKQANKEKKLEQRRQEMEILAELRKPCEDMELPDHKPMPEYAHLTGLRLSGKAFADALMVFEFLHNFGETLGFDMDSLPTLDSLQNALQPYANTSSESEDELHSIMTHLLVCAIEDPGIPNPARHTTILGQSLRQADITHANLSEILRIYLYANATGEVKLLSGVHFERDREKRIADHHQTDEEMQQTATGKNAQYYELLHENRTWKLSDMLKDKPFMALSAGIKAEILAYICNELLQNKAVLKQIENSMENVSQQRKEKWMMDAKIRKLKNLHGRKVRAEAVEKIVNKTASGELSSSDSNHAEPPIIAPAVIAPPVTADSPALHVREPDNLLMVDDEEIEMSEVESVGTQPEEEEDNKLSGEELGKKLEKLQKCSDMQQIALNGSIHQLRATCFGQDRYWRRYWLLSKCGGIYVEAMESAEPEIFDEEMRLVQNGEDDDDDNILEEQSELISEQDIKSEDPSEQKIDELSSAPVDEKPAEIPSADCSSDGNLARLRKSVDDMVHDLERSKDSHNEMEDDEGIENDDIEMEKNDDNTKEEKKFSLFEKLGQCMERENKSEQDLRANVKAEVKEELKMEILNELKTEFQRNHHTASTDNLSNCEDQRLSPKLETTDETGEQLEKKWFHLVEHKDIQCDSGPHMIAGNHWDDHGSVGACTRDNITELKIPVFPPPMSSTITTNSINGVLTSSVLTSNIPNCSSGCTSNLMVTCDSPAPLQMTPEESVQLEQIKLNRLPLSCPRRRVPYSKKYGWWRITEEQQLKNTLNSLHARGLRERDLKRNVLTIMQSLYETLSTVTSQQTAIQDDYAHIHIEQGRTDLSALQPREESELPLRNSKGVILPETTGSWNASIAHRVDLSLLEQVEALEDKVASASMQVKGWRLPSRDSDENIVIHDVVSTMKERLTSLEQNIERRYLKPPLGAKPSCLNISSSTDAPTTSQQTTSTNNMPSGDDTNNLSVGAQSPNQNDAPPMTPPPPQTPPPHTTPLSSPMSLNAVTPISNQGGFTTMAGSPMSVASSSGGCAPSDNGGFGATIGDVGSINIQQPPSPDILPKGLTVWREAVMRAQTSAQLAMCLYSLESCIAWDKSIMKAVSCFPFSIQRARKYNSKLSNCQFCLSGDNEDKLLLCDGCDKGYHTYCFKPKMDNIPDGDWYCHECMNKATGERNCIVCGKKTASTGSKLVLCELCPRAYHCDCIQPHLPKAPRGKWYCSKCVSKKPQKKSHSHKKHHNNNNTKPPTSVGNSSTTSVVSENDAPPASPAPSHSSTATNEEQSLTISSGQSECQNNSSSLSVSSTSSVVTNTSATCNNNNTSGVNNNSSTPISKKEKNSKKLLKELVPCKTLLEDLECHDDAWPFLLPVNTKQFPTYKKIIKSPMDLSTIKKKLIDLSYKSRDEFCSDVRQIFTNCEVFNEDDSPVGKAGHCMRQYFEDKWSELCASSNSS